MEKRTLGRTGLNVAVVGFGTLPMGGFYGPVDDAVSIKALHVAIDAGMNFIDTSDAYGAGHSERVVGAFLKERADRDQILICTKGGNNMITGVRNFTPDYIRGCVEGSLQRLGIAAIDLYLLHNPTLENMQARDSFDVIETYKAQGKIKHWVSVNTLPECDYVVASGVGRHADGIQRSQPECGRRICQSACCRRRRDRACTAHARPAFGSF